MNALSLVTSALKNFQPTTSVLAGGASSILVCAIGAILVAAGVAILNSAGIPTFTFPDTATRIFTLMWRYAYNLRGIYETPVLTDGPQEESQARENVRTIIEEARSRGRTLLTEYESKQILALCGIPAVETRIARSEEEAEAGGQIHQ